MEEVYTSLHYKFELRGQLIQDEEHDGWKEIPVTPGVPVKSEAQDQANEQQDTNATPNQGEPLDKLPGISSQFFLTSQKSVIVKKKGGFVDVLLVYNAHPDQLYTQENHYNHKIFKRLVSGIVMVTWSGAMKPLSISIYLMR